MRLTLFSLFLFLPIQLVAKNKMVQAKKEITRLSKKGTIGHVITLKELLSKKAVRAKKHKTVVLGNDCPLFLPHCSSRRVNPKYQCRGFIKGAFAGMSTGKDHRSLLRAIQMVQALMENKLIYVRKMTLKEAIDSGLVKIKIECQTSCDYGFSANDKVLLKSYKIQAFKDPLCSEK